MSLQVVAGPGPFQRDGFAPLPAFLAPGEVSQARDLVARRLAEPLDAGCVRPHNTLVPLRWNDALVERLLTPERLERVRTVTRGSDVKWISGYISTKDPRSPPLWWHQDWWCWDHPVTFQPEAAQVAVLCYLQETGPGNGGLRLLPGSHHHGKPIHALLPEAHAAHAGGAMHGIPETHPALQDQPGQVTMAARPGDAVAIDYRLLHGTHANPSSLRRDCIVLNVAPSWGRLPADIRGHLVQHTALPSPAEEAAGAARPHLPTFDGERRDLRLSRDAPAAFDIASSPRVGRKR